MLALIVCGSRDWTDVGLIHAKLAEHEEREDFLIVVEGGARGADRIAGKWAARARQRGVGWVHVPAEWTVHAEGWCPGAWCAQNRSCKGAGARRNAAMLEYALGAERQFVLAFKDGYDPRPKAPGGTENMVQQAKAASVHGLVVSHSVS